MHLPHSSWSPGGTLVWTTDFGLENGFVGTMTGVVAGRVPDARQLHLTHGIPPQSVAVAALELRAAWPFFPAGALHVAVVDPGVGTEREVLLALQDGRALLAPDNGLIPAALDKPAAILRVPWRDHALPEVSRTFHGRDVFAPLAAALLRGELTAGEMAECSAPVTLAASELPVDGLAARPGRVRILMADHFGNLLLAWRLAPGEALPAGLRVRAAGRSIPCADTYGRVSPGEPLVLLDSWGLVEIAVRGGHAARVLGLAPGDSVDIEWPL
ncbi:MAG: SAM-dependent chlorinase/fluorinase [Planctomycetota bacterium]